MRVYIPDRHFRLNMSLPRAKDLSLMAKTDEEFNAICSVYVLADEITGLIHEIEEIEPIAMRSQHAPKLASNFSRGSRQPTALSLTEEQETENKQIEQAKNSLNDLYAKRKGLLADLRFASAKAIHVCERAAKSPTIRGLAQEYILDVESGREAPPTGIKLSRVKARVVMAGAPEK